LSFFTYLDTLCPGLFYSYIGQSLYNLPCNKKKYAIKASIRYIIDPIMNERIRTLKGIRLLNIGPKTRFPIPIIMGPAKKKMINCHDMSFTHDPFQKNDL